MPFCHRKESMVYYEDTGPTHNITNVVVLLTGFGEQIIRWHDIPANLARDGFRVITLDNRDSGYSLYRPDSAEPADEVQGVCERPRTNFLRHMAMWMFAPKAIQQAVSTTAYRIADMAEDVVAVLNELHIYRPVSIFGTSMGGLIAQEIAINFPDRVRAVVLLSSPHMEAQRRIVALPESEIMSLVGEVTRQAHEKEKDNAMSDEGRDKHEHFRVLLSWHLSGRQTPLGDLKEYHQVAHRRNLTSDGVKALHRQAAAILIGTGPVTRIRCPVLIVHGTKDTLVHVKHAQALRSSIPNSRFVVVQDMAHSINSSRIKRLYNMLIKGFLEAPHF